MSSPRFSVPLRIETERVVVRRFVPDDAAQISATLADNMDHLARYMEWLKFEPQSEEQRRAWIAEVNAEADAGNDYALGMFDRDGTYLGGSGYHVVGNPDRLEIGYWIRSSHEGRGLITEVAAALTFVALEVAGADIVDIAHAPSNDRSAKVPARLGYAKQPTEGHACFDSGSMVRAVMWWATRETLLTEPLASTARPRICDADGREVPWPA